MGKYLKISQVLLQDDSITLRGKMAIAAFIEFDKKPITKIAKIITIDRRSISKALKNKEAMKKANDSSKGFLQIRKLLFKADLQPELIFLISIFEEFKRYGYDDIFPSEHTLANRLGVDVRTLRRYKSQLKSLNILNWEYRETPKTKSIVCFYELIVNNIVHKCPDPLRKNVPTAKQICPNECTKMTYDKDPEKDSLKRPLDKATQKSCVSSQKTSTHTERHTETLYSLTHYPAPPLSPNQKGIQHYDDLFAKCHNEGNMVTHADTIDYWRALLIDNGYEFFPQMSFSKKERGMLKNLLKCLGLTTWQLLKYAVENWEELKPKIKWSDYGKTRLPQSPTFMNIYYAKEDILIVMDKGNKGRTDVITISKPSDIPMNHPERDKYIERLKKNGEFKIMTNRGELWEKK